MTKQLRGIGEFLALYEKGLARTDARNHGGGGSAVAAFADILPGMVSYLDVDLRYCFVNRAYMEWFDVERESLVGKSVFEVVGPVAFEKVKPHLDEALSGRKVQFGSRIPYKKQGLREMLVEYIPEIGPDGKVAGILVHARDITELQDARAKAQVNESWLEIALDAGRMGIWELDMRTGAVTRTKNHDKLYGYETNRPVWTYADFMGKVHPEDRATVQKQFDDALASGADGYEGEFRLVWEDGSTHWAASRAKFLRDEGGEVTGLLGAIIDVTRIKGAEERLQVALKAREDFLGVASHELRTPITSLGLQLQIMQRKVLMQKEFVPNAAFQHSLDLSIRQVSRLSSLVSDLLDVTRSAAGRLEHRPASMDLRALLEEVLERFSSLAEEAGSSLGLRTKNLENGEALLGAWDRDRLEQVIVNLVTNAIKYGAGKPIAIELERSGRSAVVTVRDQGIGIAPEDHSRIFERFERAASADHVTGLGLGLFIVREIVHAHGGRISVESAPGRGSVFRVEFPI